MHGTDAGALVRAHAGQLMTEYPWPGPAESTASNSMSRLPFSCPAAMPSDPRYSAAHRQLIAARCRRGAFAASDWARTITASEINSTGGAVVD
jgi:hypothetical protein